MFLGGPPASCAGNEQGRVGNQSSGEELQPKQITVATNVNPAPGFDRGRWNSNPMDVEHPAPRVIIADDHALVRGGIAMLMRILDKDCKVIETNSYERTLAALSEHQDIDLVLLDLLMPGLNGIDDVIHICKTWPDVPIVLVTVEENNSVIQAALNAGVSGYIPKSSTPEVTMSAIRLVLSGGIYVPMSAIRSPEGASIVDDRRELGPPARPGAKPGLTKRQCEILELIALGKSNKAISEELGLTPGTVKAHLSRIFKALKVKNRTEAARKYSSL